MAELMMEDRRDDAHTHTHRHALCLWTDERMDLQSINYKINFKAAPYQV